MCLSLAYANEDQLDTASVIDVSQHNVLATSDTLEWDFDLKTLWLTKSRWTMMVNQYLDGDAVLAWLAQCMSIGHKGRGQATLRTNTVKSQGGRANGKTNKERRRWGSCMLAVVYKALPTPTITLHSRTSYLGYLSALDVSVAQKLGIYVADLVGLTAEDIGFVWQIDSIQYHSFKSLAFLLSNDDDATRRFGRRVLLLPHSKMTEDERPFADAPAIRGSRLWLAKVRKEDQEGLTYGQMNYNTYRRIRRRWHTEVRGYDYGEQFEGFKILKDGSQGSEFFKRYNPLPHVFVSGLDLSTLGLPRGRLLDIMDGVQVDIESDDEEDEE